VASELFGSSSPVGKYIRISGKQLLVIGVLQREGSKMFSGPSGDYRVMVPFKLLAGLFDVNSDRVEKVITIRADDYESVPLVESQTIGIMRVSRGLKPSQDDNFAINKQESLMAQFDVVFGTLRSGGWLISIFSILIGGFSIGNIMYIAVKERTNEIGVQKALGATQRFILYQFLAEAVVVCVLGGLLGMVLVVLFGELAQLGLKSAGMDFKVVYSWVDLGIGLGLSIFIGLVAGIVPSTLAARLDPVVAIRQA
jgi:putative ABC transport system permease protein